MLTNQHTEQTPISEFVYIVISLIRNYPLMELYFSSSDREGSDFNKMADYPKFQLATNATHFLIYNNFGIIMELGASQEKTTVIQCYALPLPGHCFPLLKVLEILAQRRPHFKITFYISAFMLQKLKPRSSIKIEPINPEMTEEGLRQMGNLPKNFSIRVDHVLRINQQYLQKKTNKPDLLICDYMNWASIDYARTNKIKCLVISMIPYGQLKYAYGLPCLESSFSFAGLTVLYPKPLNVHELMGFFTLPAAGKCNTRLLTISALGLEDGTSMPANHSFIGLLPNAVKVKEPIDEQLASWIQSWKAKGKKKFIYISFGTITILAEQFAFRLLKIIQQAQYPAIWSLKADFVSKMSSKYIFHRQWQPQQAILGLPQVKCYISHCGWGSISEAVANQTPLICIPGFGDQLYNADLVHRRKIGIQIYKPWLPVPKKAFHPWISDKSVSQAIQKIMTDETYERNIKKINSICKTFKTEQILPKIVDETLEIGYDHLIDHRFQENTGKSLFFYIKWLLVVLLAWYLARTFLFKNLHQM